MNCHICGKDIPTRSMAYRKVVGYVRDRGSRGGANQITLRRETGELACEECIEREKLGIHEDQMTLA